MEKGTRPRPLILKHRCNSQEEIDAALAEGFDGVEIDLIWHGGSLSLAHEHGYRFGPNLEYINFRNCVVAVNVKEYGMSDSLELPTAREWFVFDVPGPELDLYGMKGHRVFGRYSQFEDQCRLGVVTGVLIDDFTNTAEGQLALYFGKVQPIALISNQLRNGVDSAFVVEKSHYVIRKTLP